MASLTSSRASGRFVLCAGVLALSIAAGAAAGDGDLRVVRSTSKGLITFVTAEGGGTIPVAPGPGRSAPAAGDFLRQHGHLFGVRDVSSELALSYDEFDSLGHRHTTFEQIHRGVPVFSGMLKIHQNASGEILAANGHFYPISGKLDVVPAITAAAAAAIAADALGIEEPGVDSCELVVVDPGWYGDPPLGARLAYYVVIGDAQTGVREALFVDAHHGEILDRWSLLYHVLDRSIHDGGGTNALPGPLARAEGDPPHANADVNAAYDYAGDTYDYLFRGFGRDGIDGQGGRIVATVNSTATGCPNAAYSFNRFQSVFCTGVASDDIVAHELAHGLTQFTANLIYQNQSGQLNESFSDVFGELVDLFNGDAAFVNVVGGPPFWPAHPTGPGQDSPNNLRFACSPGPGHTNGVRWLMGEDANAFSDAIRDLWSPPCSDDPDYANSPLQTCSLIDNGGVHSGSGVPNHAFAMLTDGKTFNGITVNGIGPIKAGTVWYRGLSVYLTVASDFEDAYAALNQAAADLVGTFPNDPRTGQPSDSLFTLADAEEVDKALRAVEMNTAGRCGGSISVLDSTPPFECAAPEMIYADDFESGAPGWTVANSAPPTPYDWVLTDEPLPFGRSGRAWFIEDRNIGGCGSGDVGETGVHYLLSPVIALPANLNLPLLAFTHFVETEPRWDGGDVRISVSGGPWQKLPVAAFHHSPYNFNLFTTSQGNTNPYSGQLAFTGVGGVWGTSLIDLSGFVSAGDTLQVRFDFTKDHCFGITGWFVDDLRVYHCPSSGDCNANGVPDEVDIASGPYRHRFVRQPRNHSTGNPSDIDGGASFHAFADNFQVLRARTIGQIRIWGGYHPNNLAPPDHFRVLLHMDEGGLPGAVFASELEVPSTRALTGERFLGSSNIQEWVFTLTLNNPITVLPGTYFIEILNDTTGSPDTFIWQRATVGDVAGLAGSQDAPGVNWVIDPLTNMSLELYGPVIGEDCEPDAVPDDCQSQADCNANSVRDACDPCGDHNQNGGLDAGDWETLLECLSGPAVSADAECTCLLDRDEDADLDLADYAALQVCRP